MKRVIPLLLLTLFAAGCSSSTDVAATVNGVDIEVEAVRGLITTADDEVSDEQFREVLTFLVQVTAIADAARAEFDIDPTDDEIAAYSDGLFDFEGGGLAREQFLETQQVSEAGLALFASQALLDEQIRAQLEARIDEPTAEEAQQLLIDDPRSWTLVCAAHILVATEDEATAIKARLADGEDFAELAAELSTDTGSGANGGALQCPSLPSGWVDPFAEAAMTAELGTVTDPVESEFGFHLIRVDSRTEATTEEIQQQVTSTQLSGAARDWYLAALAGAEVTVAEEIGTWQTGPNPTIVPPAP